MLRNLFWLVKIIQQDLGHSGWTQKKALKKSGSGGIENKF